MMKRMKTNEVIREMMDKNGMKFGRLADALGLKTNALANRLNRGNFSTDVLGEMLDVFGYKIVLVPKDEKMKKDWYEVEKSKEGE